MVCGAEAEVCRDGGGFKEKKRGKVKEKRKEKGKGKGVERDKMEITEVLAEVRRLAGLVKILRGEVRMLSRGYQKTRREMRQWREWIDQDWVDEDYEMGSE